MFAFRRSSYRHDVLFTMGTLLGDDSGQREVLTKQDPQWDSQEDTAEKSGPVNYRKRGPIVRSPSPP